MAGFVAKKLCPEVSAFNTPLCDKVCVAKLLKLVLLPLNFDKYNAKAAEVREIIADYDARFESASIDEAYLNITEYCARHDMDAAEAVEQMRKEIHEKTRITVSAGIAANARLAKICSNLNKPNGQYVLPRERAAIMSFMRDLPCRKVNGIGRVLERELASVGIKTCGDIYPNRQYLSQLFGDKAYEFLIRCYLGLGRTNIQPAEDYERKSVGTERTFRDMSDPAQLREQLRKTAEELEKDMRRAECKGRTLCLKVKLHTYEVLTRQVVVPKTVCLADDLYNYSLPMLAKLEQEIPGMKLRLMGLRCTHLVSTKKPDTLAFFGLKPRRSESGDSDPGEVKVRRKFGGTGGEEEWEQWPQEMLEGPKEPRTEVGGAEPSPGKSPDTNSGSPIPRHGKEIIPNPQKEKLDPGDPVSEEEWWDCPICSRPQPADERRFNEHIDLCLSRQAIRETVQRDAALIRPPSVGRSVTPETKKAKEKKRGRPTAFTPDPKQKKLCFG